MATVGNLRALAQLTGRPYLELRNSAGWTGVDVDVLAREAGAEEDWAVAMTAEIIKGWRANTDAYRRIVAEIDAIDPESRGRLQTGIFGLWEAYVLRAHREFGPSALPLAWEGAVKLFDIAPPWKTGVYLAMITGLPDARSVAPVGWLIERADDKVVRDRAILTLSKLPRAAAEARIDEIARRGEALSEAAQTARELLE